MIYDFFSYRKAAPILVVGVAFFLLSCRAKTGVERVPGAIPEKDLYAVAEEDFQAGRIEEAARKYRMYAEQNPGRERSRDALHRVGEIYLAGRQYDKALVAFERVARKYPAHAGTPAVKYDIARTHYLSGDFEASRAACLEWIRNYPREPLRGDVMFLLGHDLAELGDRPRAFLWWLRTEDSPPVRDDSDYSRERIQTGIVGLIGDARMDELQKMAEHGTDSPYLPWIYGRMAEISLKEDRLEEAKRYAMLLVRSSPKQHWVSIGRDLLEKIMKRIEERGEIRIGAIGCILPLTGPYALYGQEMLNGIQLGMGLFPRSTGGQGIELIIRDTGGRAEDAAAHVEDLINKEKVMAIIGPLASGPAGVAVGKAQELGVPIITFAQKEGITEEGDMVFRNFLTPSREVETLLESSMHGMGMRRFAIFYPDNPYGTFFMNLFWDKVEEMGGEITAVESYRENETDFVDGIRKITGLYYPRPASVVRMRGEKRSGPIVDFDAVFIPDNYQRIAQIAPQFPFYDVFNVRFLGTSLWSSDELIDMTGDYIQGAIFPCGFYMDNDAPDVREFVREYKINFESDPGVLAANGYDTIRLLKELLDTGSIRSRRDFQRMLLQYDLFYGVTGRISFDSRGEVEKRPLLLTVDGKGLELLR